MLHLGNLKITSLNLTLRGMKSSSWLCISSYGGGCCKHLPAYPASVLGITQGIVDSGAGILYLSYRIIVPFPSSRNPLLTHSSISENRTNELSNFPMCMYHNKIRSDDLSPLKYHLARRSEGSPAFAFMLNVPLNSSGHALAWPWASTLSNWVAELSPWSQSS